MTQKSAGARFREAAQKRKQSTATQELEAPSGMVYVVKVPDLQKFVLGGVLPLELANKMQSLKSSGATDAEAFAQLDTAQQEKLFNFSRELIADICVSPRIVEKVLDAENEISFTDLATLPDDFAFLANFAKTGGVNAQDGVENFQS